MAEVSRPKTSGRLLSFDRHVDGIDIIDHIERRRCRIKTQEKRSIKNIPTEKFHFPVDRGVSITTRELSLPYAVAVYIRNHTGLMIDQLTSGDHRDFPQDQYSLEFSTPIKLYFSINSTFQIGVTSNEVKIEFDTPTELFIGARSHHEHPAGEIITTSDPEDMMEAVSQLSSALKTTTCERSYPTLRGHPPKITLGKELRIPQIVDKPETGIQIEIPADYQSIYAVSPLAYYFGADIIPGKSYTIRSSQGFEYQLDNTNRDVEQEIKRVLKQCFFLDCLTRTEGYYQVTLHEREVLEQELKIDFASLYDRTIAEQMEEYLDIPYGVIESYIPKWKQTAHVEVSAEHVEMIPFLIHDLAVIHSAKSSKVVRSDIKESRINSRLSTDREQPGSNTEIQIKEGSGSINNETRSYKEGDIEQNEYVQVPKCDSLEQTWVGNGIPIGASKSMTKAFKNRLEREPTQGDIEISVVVNDDQMMKEGKAVDEVYGTREWLGLSVNIHRQLSINELHEQLQEDIDFLHYIGHIDDGGFQCSDGQLDVTDVESVNIDSFFLNACVSYKQAIGLISAGSIAGIATIKPVLNSGAKRVGESVARLLNLGFPLIVALNISKSESLMGENYVVIGDGGLDLTQPRTGSPSSCELIKEGEEDTFRFIYKTYLTRRKNIGSITVPYIKNNRKYYLTSGLTGEFNMDINEIIRFLSENELPVKINSNFYWSDEVSVEKLVYDV